MTPTQLLKSAKFIVIRYEKDHSAISRWENYLPCYEVVGIYDTKAKADKHKDKHCIITLGW